ncbi:MAG: Uma2 family endonuclease [Cyanothece sp. SIO1E1]|nr:Uma2 family endonuclease [Cyanothece sp. SIO1E1]
MTQTALPPKESKTEQHFIYSGITWDRFKAMQAAMDLPGLRISYFEGEIELLAVSADHGFIAGNLGFLLEQYMLREGIRVRGFEDFSIEAPTRASAQADKTYCFDQRKPIPDLAIEIVITGEGETKLRRYAVLGVPEVWFWIDGQISAHRLEGSNYNQIRQSGWLPNLDLQRLAECAAMDKDRIDLSEEFFGA